MKIIVAIILGVVLLSSCVQKKKEVVQPLDTSSLLHQVKVNEVIQTTSYTYLQVAENGNEYWVAVGKMDAKQGDNFYYEKGLEMTDFKSKELDRVFESILFINKLSSTPDIQPATMPSMPSHAGNKAEAFKSEISVAPAEGGISIAELFAKRQSYDGKKVIVSGKVVKVNKNIMSRNWVHIQDGSNDDGNFDLTVTSSDNVSEGDVVTFEGIVSLKKDFGSGYFYELIVEEASLK